MIDYDVELYCIYKIFDSLRGSDRLRYKLILVNNLFTYFLAYFAYFFAALVSGSLIFFEYSDLFLSFL